MSAVAQREDKEYTEQLRDNLSDAFFDVTVDYSIDTTGVLSIESYELEGDNVSREELVNLFGLDRVKALEENLI